MASSFSPSFSLFPLLKFSNLIVICILLATTANPVLGYYKSIFSFGDSLADTGNALYSKQDETAGALPYGETYFHRATGRFCDGRLVLDFVAQALGMPLLPPYLGSSNKDLHQGVNFAVMGATALDSSFFEERKMTVLTNDSLGVQIQWFKKLLHSLCNQSSSDDCHEYLKTSLILMGEIGGNDYNHPFYQGRGLEEIRTFVPSVINAISLAIKALIREGVVTFMVPGNLPIGCSTKYLTIFKSSNKRDYDESGCIKWLNEFSVYHNKFLLKELSVLREEYPNVRIIYADYYNVAMKFYKSPQILGFTSGALKACCGGKGPYNFNQFVKCGSVDAIVCDDPSTSVNWDGIHLTEAAYKFLAGGLMQENYQFFFPNKNIIDNTTTGDNQAF